MSALSLFVPIRKVDVAQRLVYGVAAQEVRDRADEVMDYASAKPEFKKWSDEMSQATDGKSKGNLRAMHGKIAAGRLDSIHFNDADQAVEIVAKVVDDAEWAKVQEGVYTGFSMGGSYLKRWKDPSNDSLTRYTPVPQEISLVDRPCIPTATFDVVKADGATETRAFKAIEPAPVAKREPTNEEITAKATELATAAGDATKWADHIVAARAELEKVAPAAQAEAKPEPVDAAKGAAATPANSGDGPWEQVWLCKLDGSHFKNKDDLRAHIAQLEADAAATKAAGGILGQLDAIDAKLGIAKRDFTQAERNSAAQTGAAMPDGSFPIHNQEDLKNAVQAYGRAKDKDAAKAHIVKRAKELGLTADLPEDWSGAKKAAPVRVEKRDAIAALRKLLAAPDLRKWLGEEVSDARIAMEALSMIFSLVQSELYEDEKEPDQIASLVAAADRLKEFIVSEIQERNNAQALNAMGMAAGDGDLSKRGARNSAEDQKTIQAMHDHSVRLGADCSAAKKDAGDGADLAKLESALEKATAERNSFEKLITDTLVPRIEEVAKRVKAIEDTPLPLPLAGAARFVSKAEDSARGTPAGEPTLEKLLATDDGREMVANLLIKAAQTRPMQIGR
ncbi:MAG: hypothetical protein ACLPSW_28275 [Roseiarcus sp.]